MTISASCAACAGLTAASPPCLSTHARVFAIERLNTVTSYPALTSCPAMDAPIIPRPLYAIFAIGPAYSLFSTTARAERGGNIPKPEDRRVGKEWGRRDNNRGET